MSIFQFLPYNAFVYAASVEEARKLAGFSDRTKYGIIDFDMMHEEEKRRICFGYARGGKWHGTRESELPEELRKYYRYNN